MSTPVIFALTRHGEYHQPPGVPSAWLPHPLTEKGQAQAKALGQALIAQADQRSWQLDSRWDCSVLLRAWQTAQLAASCVSGGTEPRLCSSIALGERSLGSAANLSVAQIQEVLAKDPRFEEPAPGWKSQPWYRLPLPGAESLLEAGLRVAQYLRQQGRELARQAQPGQRTRVRVVVAHGACLRWAAHHLGVMTSEQTQACSMYHAQSVYIERRSEQEWVHVAGDWKPRTQPARD